jgi:hypothetical protein
VAITSLRRWREGEVSGVAATIDGTEVRFWSPDVELRPSPEAFASAVLVPAQLLGRGLEIDARIDARWRAGTHEIARAVEAWWGAPAHPLACRGDRLPRRWPWKTRAGTTLCFTGGVDSFHTALAGGEPTESLLLAVGYDIARADIERADRAEASTRAVATALGQQAIAIHTDLLEHPLHRETSWERTHGGPLAALAHLLAHPPRRHLISSSFATAAPRPWGSHWELDRWWSTSQTEVDHVGQDLHREGKVAAIAGHPLVDEHLTVCWEHRTADRNCGRCDKCLETMLMLRTIDVSLASLPVPADDELVRRLAALPRTGYPLAHGRLLASGHLPDAVADELRRLRARTEAASAAPPS